MYYRNVPEILNFPKKKFQHISTLKGSLHVWVCVCYLLSHDNDQIAFQARGMNSRLASQGQTSTAAAIVLEKFKVSQAAPTAAASAIASFSSSFSPNSGQVRTTSIVFPAK